MKKAAHLNLNERIHIVKKDFVDERINDRVWYETVEVKIKRMEFDETNNKMVINSGLDEEKCNLSMNEDVYISESEAETLTKNLNDRELAAEMKVYKDLKKKLDDSQKIVNFFEIEMKKIGK